MNVDQQGSRFRIGRSRFQSLFIFASFIATLNYLVHEESSKPHKNASLTIANTSPLDNASHHSFPIGSNTWSSRLGRIIKGSNRNIKTTSPKGLPSPSAIQRQLTPAGHSWTPAQTKNLAQLHWKSGKQVQAKPRHQNGTIQFLEGWRLEEQANEVLPGITIEETTAFNLLEKNRNLFLIDQPEQEWELLHSKEDSLGFTQVHFSQTYEGLEVWPSSLTVQINPHGHAHLVSGAYAPTPTDLGTRPSLEPPAALEVALNHLQTEGLPFSDAAHLEDQKLIVYSPLSSPPPTWHTRSICMKEAASIGRLWWMHIQARF